MGGGETSAVESCGTPSNSNTNSVSGVRSSGDNDKRYSWSSSTYDGHNPFGASAVCVTRSVSVVACYVVVWPCNVRVCV